MMKKSIGDNNNEETNSEEVIKINLMKNSNDLKTIY